MSHIARLAGLLKSEGFIGALRFMRRWFLYKAFYHLSDKAFEADEAVPTSRKVAASELDYDEALRRHSVEYLATPRLLVRRAISLIPEPASRFHFVDIGSGLGRPLLVASEYRFKQIVGYELSPSLHAGALANIARLRHVRAGQISSVLGNALEADWPKGSTVFFLFNPFDTEFTARFLQRVKAEIGENETAYLLFLNLKHQDLLSEADFQPVPLGLLEAVFWRVVSPYRISIYRYAPGTTAPSAQARLMSVTGAYSLYPIGEAPVMGLLGNPACSSSWRWLLSSLVC